MKMPGSRLATAGLYSCSAIVLGLLLLQFAARVSSHLQRAFMNESAGWQDEGVTLQPVTHLYRHGYREMSCRGPSVAFCYGPTQVLFDTALLKLLPAAWTEAEIVHPNPGARWYFNGEYPAFLRILRTVRVVFEILVPALIVALSLAMGLGGWIGVALGLIVGLGAPFLDAGAQGLKNDLMMAAGLMGFMVLAWRAFATLGRSPVRRAPYFGAVLVGVLIVGLKVTMVIPVALFFLAYLVAAWPEKKTSVAGGALALAFFLLLNPYSLDSSSEAAWFLGHVATGAVIASPARMSAELSSLALPLAAPWFVAVIAAFGISEIRKRGSAARWRALYFFLVPLVLLILNVKAGFQRTAYYVPVMLWLIVTLLLLGGERVRAKSFPPGARHAVYAGLLIFLLTQYALFPIRWPQIPAWDRETRGLDLLLNRDPAAPTQNWAIDLALRAPVSERHWNAEKSADGVPRHLLFFDSLTDPPAQVLAAMREKFHAPATLLVACWNPEFPPKLPARFRSPAAQQWGEVLRRDCPEPELITDQMIENFDHASYVTRFARLSGEEFEKRKPPARPVRAEGVLNPHFLSGSHAAKSYWYAPLAVESPLRLETDLIYSSGLRRIRIPFESSCKGSARVTVALLESGQPALRTEASADVAELTCRRYPGICRFGLRDWFRKRFSREPAELNLPLVRPRFKDRPARFRVETEGFAPGSCQIALGMIEFVTE